MYQTKNMDLSSDDSATLFVKDEVVEVAFATGEGELISREGPNRYQVGDALITGSTGDRWSVSRARFAARYTPVAPLQAGRNGRYRANPVASLQAGRNGRYRANPVPVLARQMPEAFTLERSAGGDVLHGLAQDWLLQYAPGDFGIIENSRFQRVYRPLAED